MGKILMQSGAGVSTDDATAASYDIVEGKSGYVDDELVVGSLPEREGEQPTLGVTISDGYAHVGMPQGAYRKNGRYNTPEVKAPVDMVAKAAGVDGSKMLQGYNVLAVPGKIPIVDSSGDNGRSTMSPWFGLDGNNRTMWIELPFRSAYYTRPDNKPHVTIDIEALGNAEAHHVLQGVTTTSKWGIKFNGSIATWNLSGDLGGTQGVVTAFQNSAFAGDYQNLGRGVFTRILGHVYMPPTTMWVWAPAPALLSQNIRAGVNILGVPGTMVDYAQNCVPFDGAHFDGVHLSGWANGLLNISPITYNRPPVNLRTYEVREPVPYNGSGNGSYWWAFTPSVNLSAFRTVRVTAYTEVVGAQSGGYLSFAAYLSRISGNAGNRTISPIRSKNTTNRGGQMILEIPVQDINKQGFIVVNMGYTGLTRDDRDNRNTRIVMGINRVELIT